MGGDPHPRPGRRRQPAGPTEEHRHGALRHRAPGAHVRRHPGRQLILPTCARRRACSPCPATSTATAAVRCPSPRAGQPSRGSPYGHSGRTPARAASVCRRPGDRLSAGADQVRDGRVPQRPHALPGRPVMQTSWETSAARHSYPSRQKAFRVIRQRPWHPRLINWLAIACPPFQPPLGLGRVFANIPHRSVYRLTWADERRRTRADSWPTAGVKGPCWSPYAAPTDARRRETVRLVVLSWAAMSRMDVPRAVMRRTTSCCSTAVRSS